MAIVANALRAISGAEPTETQVWLCSAVAALETGFGSGKGWKDPDPAELAAGSNNWGAVQTSSSVEGQYFTATDHHKDGTAYRARFRVYPTAQDGAADYLRILKRTGALSQTSVRAFAYQMHKGHYFEADPDKYAQAAQYHIDRMEKELGRKFPGLNSDGAGTVPGIGLLIAAAAIVAVAVLRKNK